MAAKTKKKSATSKVKNLKVKKTVKGGARNNTIGGAKVGP